MAKFISYLKINCITEYMAVSSYFGGIKGNGMPKILLDLPISIDNRDILLVEDIIDSGKTIKLVKEYLLLKRAKSVRVVTLLDKKMSYKINLIADWWGFIVPNVFLIGFGLDYEERLRNLPYIGIADYDKMKVWKW